jgi:PAS domain S-box-containing protein
LARNSTEIKSEIVSRFGFFPPFFEPALENPEVLENLWQQTLIAYVNNPLPDLFKEKLAAMLSRYCTVPYCLMCHSSSLKPLGMSASEVLKLLETAPLNYEELSQKIEFFGDSEIKVWPVPGSDLEEAVLSCCVSIFLNQDAELCQKKLRKALTARDYQYLTVFLAYNRTALNWAEMYPELSYQEDKRVQDHFASLVSDEPQLTEFFRNYQGRVVDQSNRQIQWLTQENKRILENERRRINSYFVQAPVGFAVVEEPEHRIVMANAKFQELSGQANFIGKNIRDILSMPEYGTFFDSLDLAFKSGKGFVETEKKLSVDNQNSGNLVDVFVNITVEPYRNERGRIAGLFIVLNEVTQQVRDREKLIQQQQLLAKSEESLAAAIDVAKVGFYDWDIVADRIEFSQQMQKDWGIAGNFKLSDAIDVIVSEDRDRTRVAINHALSTGNLYSIQHRIKRPTDGKIIWLDVRGRVKYNEQHQPLRFLGTSVDITDRKTTEGEVEALADAFPQLAWMADVEGSIFWYNQRWYDYTGSNFDEMQGWGWSKVHHPEHLDRVVAFVKEAWKKPEAWEMTFPLRRHDGEWRWFLTRAVPILDSEGKLYRWFGTNTDVTGQLNTEQQLTRFAAVVESSADFIGMADNEARPTFLNSAGRQLSGFSNRELSNISIADFFDDGDKKFVSREAFAAVASTGYYGRELNLKHFKTGELIPVHFTLFPFFDPTTGKQLGFATVTRDITEKRNFEIKLKRSKEMAERANAAKSSFLANMSHEIRSPLGAIMGFSELLKSEELNPAEVIQHVSVIDRNSHHLLRIIDDILDLAKVEAGKMLIENIEFSLEELLSDFCSLVGFRARDKGIEFRLNIPHQIPSIIKSDPTRIRQILNNVVGNAIKFTDRGTVQLTVLFKNSMLEFEITDTGAGISNDQANLLFQAFQQADVSTTRKFGGTGLGLVLTRKLSETMGGGFELKRSELGVGSTFVAILPVFVPALVPMIGAELVREAESSILQLKPSLRPLVNTRILVVDDSPDNQMLFKIMLKKLGATIEIAGDGVSGMEAAKSHDFDVVLMDIQMPVMDGHETTKKLRMIGYKVPIIALTAHAMIEERERALNSGFTDFLSKPVQWDNLVELVQKYSRSTP